MAKKKAVKKAKAASKPAKASSKKKSVPAKKSSVKSKETGVKAKAAPAKKAPAKKAAAKKTGVKAKVAPAKKSAPAKKAAPAKKVAKKSGDVSPETEVKSKTASAKPVKATAVKTVKEKPVKAVAAKPAPVKPKVKDEGHILAESVVNGMLEKKGLNIRWLDLRAIENSVCDYFIICEGNSNTQVDAIAQSVEDIVKKETGQRPYRSEGWENALWILIDYVNVVVHVFERETRYFYNLESLWADAEEIKVEQ